MEIYSSPFSQILLEQDKNLLVVSWLKNSQQLSIDGVKSEISKILDYIDRHFIENIIIDSSLYSFTDNMEIQTWINYKFMPMVMNTPVKKYGIVLESRAKKYANDLADSKTDELQVAYFPNLHDAHKWIES